MQTVADARAYEPTTALVGVATQGGRFPPAWIDLLRECVVNGLDVENGLHVFLTDDPELRVLAAEHGVPTRLLDLCQRELQEAMNRGWGDQDRIKASTLQEERAGVKLRLP